MRPTAALSQFIADTNYEDLPANTVEAAKIAIMDGVAVMAAGSALQLSRIVGEYVVELGGTPRSSVVGLGFSTNPPAAAFANGVSGHGLDFEIQGFPPTHGTSSCLPAALALGESIGASGKAVITAYTLGWEIQGRVRAASAHAMNPAYHPPGLVGPLGGTAAGAKVLELDARQVQMALGIGASRTGGLTANTGTMVKSTHPGNAARMGTEAAMLARKGFTATEAILETPRGFADALFAGDVQWTTVTQALGEGFRLIDPGFNIKRFPAQIHMQNPTETVLKLRARHSLDPSRVRKLHVRTGSRGHSGSLPRSGLDGKFSLEFCTAAALLDGEVNIQTFTDERRFSPDMEDMLGKVEIAIDPALGDNTIATATLHGGAVVSESCESYSGAAAKPMTQAQRLEKARHCFGQILDGDTTERAVQMLESLEDVDDISALMALLRCG